MNWKDIFKPGSELDKALGKAADKLENYEANARANKDHPKILFEVATDIMQVIVGDNAQTLTNVPRRIPPGYIAHVVLTKIGAIAYAYQPTHAGFADHVFEDNTDKAITRLVKNNPGADLRPYQEPLRVVILSIEPIASREDDAIMPIGEEE